MKTVTELERDRLVYRLLRSKMSGLDKMWLLDCNGDYRIYLSRLCELAKRFGVEIPQTKEIAKD